MTYTDLNALLAALGVLLVGASFGYLLSGFTRRSAVERAEREAKEHIDRMMAEEERGRRLKVLEEKDQWYEAKAQQEMELEEMLAGIGHKEKEIAESRSALQAKREDLNIEVKRFKQQENRVQQRENAAKVKESELTQKINEYQERLEVVGGMGVDEAREQMMEHLAGEVRARSAALVRAERARAKEESEREAKKIIAMAIQRCVVDEAVQVTTSSVALPNEGIKSRIIGKEGRNVRTFESATGVKVVVDDTPETVLLSTYDPARREIASQAMQKLIADGGFSPSRIEEIVEACRKDLNEEMIREGEKALEEIGAKKYHTELPHYVGMLKYRASFGQNLLQHCLEVAHLAGLMAAELRLDVRLAKRAGLLHDIGKTVSREMEGSHVELGIELGDRFEEHSIVKEAIAEHHEDNERMSSIGFLVKAADTISSIRPGGRREDLEGYARRIMRLEEVANSFEGVKDVYAINAGREIRVMVEGQRIGDDDAEMLAFDIAERVKNELTFAGQVKVMVVRETQAIRHTGRSRGSRPKGRVTRGRGRGRRNRQDDISPN